MPRVQGGQKTRKPTPGLFVVIEGADASGKTTLAHRLVTYYRRRKHEVVAVREPGGTRTSERIRRVLLDPTAKIAPRSELFLYLAARAQLVDEVIAPALARGAIVIADRFSLSTIAYQVGGRKLPLEAVRVADKLARNSVTPHLTIVLGVTPRQQAERKRKLGRAKDRIELEGRRFSNAVRSAYRKHGRGPGHLWLDTDCEPEQVFAKVVCVIDRRLTRLN